VPVILTGVRSQALHLSKHSIPTQTETLEPSSTDMKESIAKRLFEGVAIPLNYSLKMQVTIR
jgi:hypothetical protein